MPVNSVPEVSAVDWPLQDRVRFLPWIAETFKYAADDASGAPADQQQRTLFAQQKFVRDYLQPASPYRGLLLVHSLGVGKTCAAIAAAEALRPSTTGDIFVMTTKMLKSNFAEEVPSCVAPELLRQQPWTLLPMTDPSARATAARLPASMVKKNGGVWVAGDVGTEYGSLDTSSQQQIDAQVDAIVSASFRFVHYNGLTKDHIDRMFQGARNPFDGAIVIIDEVHNFISRVMNKRLVAPVYERLLDAVGCKVILLSGTPIVNRTAELAYIVNLVQGRTLVHELKLRAETTQDAVDAALAKVGWNKYFQVFTYEPGSRSVRMVYAPHGFEMVPGEPGVVRSTASRPPDVAAVGALLSKHGLKVSHQKVHAALPLPDDVEVFDANFVDWEQGAVMNPMLLQRRMVGAVSSYSNKDTEFFASVSPINIVHAEMSGLQFIKYAQMRYEERRRERNIRRIQARANRQPSSANVEGENAGEVYRTFSLALCTFAFPDEITRPFKFQMRQRLREESAAQAIDNEALEREYEAGLEHATRRLREEMPQCLTRDGALAVHSPKFVALIDRVEGSPGPALVYSQFRRAEGIGLLSAVFDTNGWSELRLVRQNDSWTFRPDEGAVRTKHYIILRTEEDPECNRLLLHIFNNELDQLPRATRDSLPGTTNLRGEIVRVLMITASAAEGISLKNVRQVHMVEGFWNHNRIDQVIGRGVRARSHMDLPAEERHVDVFLYLATFDDEQRKDHAIMHHDKGLTSDQYVHAVAMKKKHLTDQVLALMKSASVDCMVHAKSEQDKTACFTLPRNLPLDEQYRTMAFDDDLNDASYAKRVTKLVVVQVDGAKFFMDTRSGALYDYEKLKSENVLLQVGKV